MVHAMVHSVLSCFHRYVLQLSLVQYCQHKLMVRRHALERDMNMVTPVPLHVTLDTNERGALRDHVKPTDSGQVNKLVVKVS